MSIQGKSISILTPMYGGLATANHIDALIGLIAALARHGLVFNRTATYNESLIPRARNRLADEYLKKSMNTHALFVDADIGFDPNDVLAMLELDVDIVGAPCPKKSIRWDRIQKAIRKNGREYTPDELARVSGDFVFNFEPFVGKREFKLSEPQEMRNLGTGLLMVKREVFEKFRLAYPDRWYEAKSDPASLPGPIHDFFKVGINTETREYDSEDYWFCVDAKAIGFKIWMCPWIVTTHMGTHKFIGDMPAVAALAGEI